MDNNNCNYHNKGFAKPNHEDATQGKSAILYWPCGRNFHKLQCMLYSIYIRIKQSIVFKLEFLNQNLVYSLDKLVNFIQCPSNLILNSPTDLFAPPMNIMMNKKNSVTQYVNQHITIATSFASLNLNCDFAVKVVLLSAISPLLKIYILFLNNLH